MDQRISLVTLGVEDLPRACAFYEALGWTVGNDWAAQGVAFFQAGGMILGLWDRDELAKDSGTSAQPPGAVTLAHNVVSPALVDSVLEEARAAGATIVREGAETFWGGYSAAFLDPDGHPWEIAHNPGWHIAEDGSISLQ
jgi:catechol 2,3-dioxygenase-like lactoylglutathione lyase family enzyme